MGGVRAGVTQRQREIEREGERRAKDNTSHLKKNCHLLHYYGWCIMKILELAVLLS